MTKITFIAFDGTRRTVEVATGTIDSSWADRVGVRTPCEVDMLNLVSELRDTSRLACQIEIVEGLDGLIVATPESQH
jgi:ferredoxin